MNEVRFRISIPADEYLLYYQGKVNTVHVTTNHGKTIQFPAGALQKFVDQNGVKGSFRVIYDDNNKLVQIERVSY